VLARLPEEHPGAPGRALVMFRDALAQAPDVAALRDREAFLRAVLDHSQHGVWIVGNAGTAPYVNAAAARMLGYDTEEFLQVPMEGRFHPDEIERIRGYIAARRAGQDAPAHYRTRLLHRDGRTIWVDRSVTMLPMGNGQERILVEHRDVTADVERAEQETDAQRAEAERLQRILVSFQNGIIITDNHGNVVFANPAMTSMLGYTPEEYLATTFAQRIHPDDLQYALDIARDRLAGKDVPSRYRIRMLHRDGSTVWVDRSVALVVANGVIEGSVAENMDVTEQVLQAERAAEAQRAETERLQSILDNFRVGVTIRTPGGRTVFCNPAMADMLGYTIEEFMARPILEHVHPDDREMVNEFGRRRTAGEDAPSRYRVRLLHRTGRTVWVDRSISMMTFDGIVQGTLGENVDITDQVLREEQEAAAQRAETARLRRILENFQSGVAIFDLDGRSLFCNPAMGHMLGYTVEEFLSLPPFGHIHPDDAEMVRGLAAMRAAGLDVPDRYRVRMRHRDGSVVIVDRSVTMISTPGEAAAVLVEHRDVTEEVRRTEQEQATREMAAQRLQSLVSAAMAVNSAATVEDRLRVLTEVARTLIPAHQSVTSLINGHSQRLGITAISLSERYAHWRDYDVPTDGSGIYRLVLEENRPFR
ncbi:MAG: PAS domain S-box protein, partial [Dehalococcoidia bacterium]|nr:PAS domain S-box protein [Dehalococcoidia bacterium]